MTPAQPGATRARSLLKALTYRVVIVVLDFAVLYLFTKRTDVAVGFTLVSNVYTTVGYFLHERFWARVRWGLVAALRWLTPGIYGMETPRRSVDRELEQFSSPWD